MQARPGKSIHDGREFGDIRIFSGDLPEDVYSQLAESGRVAWDIETNGLDPRSAQIGTCQLYSKTTGPCVVTRVADERPQRLARLLANDRVLKVFHHAPFDLSFMAVAWGVEGQNVACTKIAAKMLNPGAPAEEFSLQFLMRRNFNLHLDKRIRFTDWMAASLSEHQVQYAVGDVILLLDLYDLLTETLAKRGLTDLYRQCTDFLPTHVSLKLLGCPDPFSY